MWRLRDTEIARFNSEVAAVVEQLQRNARVLEIVDPSRAESAPSLPACDVTLVVVPGAFAKEYPQHDARGQRIVDAAAALGVTAEVVDTPSFCSPAVGADHIAAWFKGSPKKSVVLVSLSKGSADAASFFSLPEYQHLHHRIRAWISIGGVLFGTPIVNRIHAHPLRRLLVAAMLRLRGYRYSDLLALMWDNDRAPEWNSCGALSIPVVHVQGVPRYEDLSSPLAIRAVRRALPYGVSDGGGVLLSDLHRYFGSFVLVKDRDHYFKEVPIPYLLSRLLLWAGLGTA